MLISPKYLIGILVYLCISFCFADSPSSFAQAKKIADQLFSENRQTLYCQCEFDEFNEINLDSCNMQSANPIKRAHQMEWEHIMPAEMFGHHFECWQKPLCENKGKRFKGRRCCGKINTEFKHIEAELYNLWPAVGLVNQARSNYRYAKLENEPSFHGCEFKINKKLHRAEPPDRIKGLVARASLFVSNHYGIHLSDDERLLFNSWNKLYPPTESERKWANQVAQVEGYNNPYIDHWPSSLKQKGLLL